MWQPVPHKGLSSTSFPKIPFAVTFATANAYRGRMLSLYPATNGTVAKRTRNGEKRTRHAQGESLSRLAEVFGVSAQRVSQIVQGKRD